MTHELNMDRISKLVEDSGVPCFVEMTGGGVATIYAGEPKDDVWPACAGPGTFGYDSGPSLGDDREFSIGPDAMAPDADLFNDYIDCAGKTEAEIAALIVERAGS